jgi:hypothetical protein
MQSTALNALLGSGKHGHGSGHSNQHGSNPLGSLASQFLGGQHGSSSHGSGGKPSGAGKIVGQLASNFLSSSSNKPTTPQNYHGGHTSGQSHNQGGLTGAVMGGVSSMFGGNKPGHGSVGVWYSFSLGHHY